MIRIHVIGDGDRDGATVPALVTNLLGVDVEGTFFPWNSPPESKGRKLRMNTRGGYAKKIAFAIERARHDRAAGLVAVVDRDVEPTGDRLDSLRLGRESDRRVRAPIPTAIGEAVPHGEAWLLDDRVAVRDSLYLEDRNFHTVDESNPKSAVDALIDASPRREEKHLDVLRDIANQVARSRCPNTHRTGFASFADEVRHEFRDLAKSSPR